jgi:hypothetical protein
MDAEPRASTDTYVGGWPQGSPNHRDTKSVEKNTEDHHTLALKVWVSLRDGISIG